jgi:AmiR/NasT family two-component response regulator
VVSPLASAYTHLDGTQTIANTIVIFPDASATAAINQARAAGKVANGQRQRAALGTGG